MSTPAELRVGAAEVSRGPNDGKRAISLYIPDGDGGLLFSIEMTAAVARALSKRLVECAEWCEGTTAKLPDGWLEGI